MRLFVALELPAVAAATLGGWAARAAEQRGELRRVPASSLHITLCFLGTRPSDEVPAIGVAVGSSAAPVPGLALRAPAWLPPHRPGVLAVDLADREGACTALQRAVAVALAGVGAYEPERRRFRPHVTVARVRRGGRPRQAPLPELPALGPFSGDAVTLFRSRLDPAGARYEALVRVVLSH